MKTGVENAPEKAVVRDQPVGFVASFPGAVYGEFMRRRPFPFGIASAWLFASLSLSVATAGEATFRDEVAPLLRQYCGECHQGEGAEAAIDLSVYRSRQDVYPNRRVWRRVREVIESGAMPPESMPGPTEEERAALLAGIDSAMHDVDWEAVRSPGSAALARLTREEYRFTVADLFGVTVDVADVLAEDPEGLSGFANDRSSMVMTAARLESTLNAATRVADAVIDAHAGAVSPIGYEVETGEHASFGQKVTRRGDDVVGWTFSPALGRKYQSVRKAIDFPRTGTYSVRVRAASTGPGPSAGMWIAADSVNDASREPGVLVEGKALAEYETEMFLTAGRHDILFGYDFYRPPWLPDVPDRPQMKLGQSTFDPPPYDESLLPDGVTYRELLAVGDGSTQDDESRIRELMATANRIYYRAVLDRLLRDRFHFERGYLPVFVGGLGYDYQTHVVPAFEELAELLGVSRKDVERVWRDHETPLFRELETFSEKQRQAWREQDESRKSSVGGLFVDRIEFRFAGKPNGETGDRRDDASPLDSPRNDSPRSGALPAGRGDVDGYLSALLPKAFRRPVSEEERERYRDFYRRERDAGGSHVEAVRRLLVAVLVSPGFLYRHEGDPPVGVEPLGDHALASRLSYWLTASMPDDVLLAAAGRGVLNDPDQIGRHVERILDGDTSYRLAARFTTEWLKLSGIGREKEPDKELFRFFSWHLAEDMRREVALTFDRMVREDRPIIELLNGDETYLNERLARLYGIEGVAGDAMRPVRVEDPSRGGLLGTAAVLTTTSLATRTSPVRRGAFVVETVLGNELPPPPPDVGDLPEEAGQSESVSVRRALEAHRDNVRCAGCHNKIDPPGFALEHFDWIGRRRSRDPAGPIDASARLPDGTEVGGVAELKAYLAENRKDDFTRALTERMLAHALGRELDYFDEHAIGQIVSAVRRDGYRARTLIREIATSYPFRYRAGE